MPVRLVLFMKARMFSKFLNFLFRLIMNYAEELRKEVVYRFSRSAGPGGQNVNKLATKVDLSFDVLLTALFDAKQKELIFRKLANRINKNGVLKIQSQKGRTQSKNKTHAFNKLLLLLEDALQVKKIRKASKPSALQKQQRLQKKKHQALRKQARKKVNLSKQIDLFSIKSVSFV